MHIPLRSRAPLLRRHPAGTPTRWAGRWRRAGGRRADPSALRRHLGRAGGRSAFFAVLHVPGEHYAAILGSPAHSPAPTGHHGRVLARRSRRRQRRALTAGSANRDFPTAWAATRVFLVLRVPEHLHPAVPAFWARGYGLYGSWGGAVTGGGRSGSRGGTLRGRPKRAFCSCARMKGPTESM